MPHVTQELVGLAYDALATGNREEIERYWDTDMRWLVPGHNPLSGWYYGLDAFLEFMGQAGVLSGRSFKMDNITTLVNDEWSADVTHNTGFRAGMENTGTVPYSKLDIDVIHLLRWQNGKIVEGRGAIFGDGTNEYDLFWAPAASRRGERLHAPGTGRSNKDVIRQLVQDVWNTGDAERVDDFYAKNFIFFQEGGDVQIGADSIKRWLEATHGGFPDIEYKVDAVYAEGDKAAMRYHVCGTHTADFRGIPATNKSINLTGHMMFRLLDGKILQAWGFWDMLGLLQQLGIMPPMGPPRR